ncbi:MAG: hypothetical protein ABIS14_11585 [Sphingomonas sp.]
MADRVIRVRDLAEAMQHAAGQAVAGARPADPRLTGLHLAVPLLSRTAPIGEAIWDMTIRQSSPCRYDPFAWAWRRWRRMTGWKPGSLALRWTAADIAVSIDGQPVARLSSPQFRSKTDAE